MATNLRRIVQSGRRLASTHAGEAGAHGAESFLTYKYGSLVAIPFLGLLFYKHIIAAEHPEPPPYVEYDHLRIQKKKFPWGDGNKSLFYNPHMQGSPEEREESHHDHSEPKSGLTLAMERNLGSHGREEVRMQHVARVREAGAAAISHSKLPTHLYPEVQPQNTKEFYHPKRTLGTPEKR